MSSFTQLGPEFDGEAANDRSGSSISLSSNGSIIAIGTSKNDGNGEDSGHTRIYQWDAGSSSWNQLGSDIDGDVGHQSGDSVSLSSDGHTIAISEPGVNSRWGAGSKGRTRIFTWNGDAWVQRGSAIDGRNYGDYNGTVSLSSDGSVVAIGAYHHNGLNGHTRIFQWDAGSSSWNQLGEITGAHSDRSGRSVSLSSDGTVIAVGEHGSFQSGNGFSSGRTRLFAWNGSSWVQRGSDIDGEAASDVSGYSVSLSGDGTIVAVGAYGADGNGEQSGHTRLYQWDAGSSSWNQLGSDIDGEAAGDRSGYSVALSSDGTVVAIGALRNDGNGTHSGHTRIYQWSGSAWVQIGTDVDGEAEGDESGDFVSLSRDGSTVAIGARLNDGNGNEAGHVRVFSLDITPPTIAISSDVSSLKAGETATLTFTLSEASSNFVQSDVTVSGGTLSNWNAASATSYSATFTPTANSTTNGVISVASGTFTDAANNANTDGSDSNNSVTLSVDTVRPTFQSAASNTGGIKIILTYSETLSSTTAAIGTFSVTTASKNNPVTDVAIAGSTAELTLTNTIVKGQTVSVAYTDPSSSDDANAIQDSTGNDAASLSSTSVTNNSTVASDSSDKGSSDNNVLVLNSDNSFIVTDGDTKGLWLKFNVKAASTKRQNCLKIIDQHGSVLGAIGATQDSKNLGSHAIFIPEGSTIAFHQFSNNQAINSSPQLNIIEQADGSFQLKLNDGADDSDHDDLTIDITSFTSSPNASATSIATEQTGIHDSILDLSSIPAAGETLQLTINSDCSFKNSIAMVKLTEETDGSFSVNGKTNADATAFDQAVKDHLINPNGTSITATGVQTQTIDWTLASADAGFYSPVLINPDGELYTYGSSYVKILGCNFFSFEDTHQNSSSDFDYNDVSILFQVI
ncbi:Ig-like domain-containing protein [Synechococcus sp. MIT S9451]|uniref:Ig-like domain-containing protein n=1 Tax=Synechococcus sp. MIT S9451 TaxID=3082543 RepID=UPI0039B621A6